MDRFRTLPFGARVEDEATFGGYTIPTRLRAGWHIDTDRFEPEGEFFRVTRRGQLPVISLAAAGVALSQ